jgi:hypothetical protein
MHLISGPAPESWPEKVWVCPACGKVSGNQQGSYLEGTVPGWDISCAFNGCEIERKDLVLKKGRVVEAKK